MTTPTDCEPIQLQLWTPVPPGLRAAFDRQTEAGLKVSSEAWNAVLLKHRAVVAGSFCIPPIAEYLTASNSKSAVNVSPGDVDVWVAKEEAKAFLGEVVELFGGPPEGPSSLNLPSFVRRRRPIQVRQNKFELSEYNRLREDVEAIYHVAGDAGRMNLQVLACRNLPRALASFDINVAAVAWTGGDAIQVWAQHALSGIRDGAMQLNGVAMERQSAVELRRTLLRLRKYMAFGFTLVSVNPLVAALHEHFGVECGKGEILCEGFATYFTDRNKPFTAEDSQELRKQAERARLVRYLMRLVKSQPPSTTPPSA